MKSKKIQHCSNIQQKNGRKIPNLWFSQGHPPPIKLTATIYTHYIHSVVVQDFVLGRACCVNQYHYESRERRVVIRLFHATSKTCYKVLYKRTMYVISLSNISIKTSFKQITRVDIRLTNVYNTLRETTFCALLHVCCRSFYCFVKVAHIDAF